MAKKSNKGSDDQATAAEETTAPRAGAKRPNPIATVPEGFEYSEEEEKKAEAANKAEKNKELADRRAAELERRKALVKEGKQVRGRKSKAQAKAEAVTAASGGADAGVVSDIAAELEKVALATEAQQQEEVAAVTALSKEEQRRAKKREERLASLTPEQRKAIEAGEAKTRQVISSRRGRVVRGGQVVESGEAATVPGGATPEADVTADTPPLAITPEARAAQRAAISAPSAERSAVLGNMGERYIAAAAASMPRNPTAAIIEATRLAERKVQAASAMQSSTGQINLSDLPAITDPVQLATDADIRSRQAQAAALYQHGNRPQAVATQMVGNLQGTPEEANRYMEAWAKIGPESFSSPDFIHLQALRSASEDPTLVDDNLLQGIREAASANKEITDVLGEYDPTGKANMSTNPDHMAAMALARRHGIDTDKLLRMTPDQVSQYNAQRRSTAGIHPYLHSELVGKTQDEIRQRAENASIGNIPAKHHGVYAKAVNDTMDSLKDSGLAIEDIVKQAHEAGLKAVKPVDMFRTPQQDLAVLRREERGTSDAAAGAIPEITFRPDLSVLSGLTPEEQLKALRSGEVGEVPTVGVGSLSRQFFQKGRAPSTGPDNRPLHAIPYATIDTEGMPANIRKAIESGDKTAVESALKDLKERMVTASQQGMIVPKIQGQLPKPEVPSKRRPDEPLGTAASRAGIAPAEEPATQSTEPSDEALKAIESGEDYAPLNATPDSTPEDADTLSEGDRQRTSTSDRMPSVHWMLDPKTNKLALHGTGERPSLGQMSIAALKQIGDVVELPESHPLHEPRLGKNLVFVPDPSRGSVRVSPNRELYIERKVTTTPKTQAARPDLPTSVGGNAGVTRKQIENMMFVENTTHEKKEGRRKEGLPPESPDEIPTTITDEQRGNLTPSRARSIMETLGISLKDRRGIKGVSKKAMDLISADIQAQQEEHTASGSTEPFVPSPMSHEEAVSKVWDQIWNNSERAAEAERQTPEYQADLKEYLKAQQQRGQSGAGLLHPAAAKQSLTDVSTKVAKELSTRIQAGPNVQGGIGSKEDALKAMSGGTGKEDQGWVQQAIDEHISRQAGSVTNKDALSKFLNENTHIIKGMVMQHMHQIHGSEFALDENDAQQHGVRNLGAPKQLPQGAVPNFSPSRAAMSAAEMAASESPHVSAAAVPFQSFTAFRNTRERQRSDQAAQDRVGRSTPMTEDERDRLQKIVPFTRTPAQQKAAAAATEAATAERQSKEAAKAQLRSESVGNPLSVQLTKPITESFKQVAGPARGVLSGAEERGVINAQVRSHLMSQPAENFPTRNDVMQINVPNTFQKPVFDSGEVKSDISSAMSQHAGLMQQAKTALSNAGRFTQNQATHSKLMDQAAFHESEAARKSTMGPATERQVAQHKNQAASLTQQAQALHTSAGLGLSKDEHLENYRALKQQAVDLSRQEGFTARAYARSAGDTEFFFR